MDWIPVERGDKGLGEVCLLCGLDEWGEPSLDLGFWDDGWHRGNKYLTPHFYAMIEWPPELVDDGAGLCE